STLLNLHHVHKVQPHNNDYEFSLSNGKQVAASRRYKLNWADQLNALPQN
ncbi:MAG: LytTR family transcriptional regulator DNA-binding domain-containing protein, partial [Gammaproteobacteria bacterium]|nr:LytTR family transcriptional regulator DNA-binding domain-containing protein [Gammaproteobacteria bacterium]